MLNRGRLVRFEWIIRFVFFMGEGSAGGELVCMANAVVR